MSSGNELQSQKKILWSSGERERPRKCVVRREKMEERFSELRGLRESGHPRQRRGWEKTQASPKERVTLGPCTKGFYLEVS